MCLLTFMPEGVTANHDDLEVGAISNPDGFGWAIHDRTRILRGHGMNFDKVVNEFYQARARCSGPALFHSRITTHGATSKANCHPFQVGRDQQTVLAHNGMLPIKENAGRSDTRIFAEDILPAMGGVSVLNSKKMRKKLSKFATGSKLVVLTANPVADKPYYIINESSGHWDHGVWWSNHSYKWQRYVSIGHGMYSSGWYQSPKSLTPNDDYSDSAEIEIWECLVCSHQAEIVLDGEYTDADFCEVCESCWYCSMPRQMCDCYQYEPAPVSYDSKDVDIWDLNNK